jgi:hypothetical protein
MLHLEYLELRHVNKGPLELSALSISELWGLSLLLDLLNCFLVLE